MADIVRREAPTTALAAWTPSQRDLVRSQIMKWPDDVEPPTDDEFALFAAICERRGLDPFAGHVYAIFRKDRKAKLGRTMTIQTGIDGFNLIAARTGKLDGCTVQWCGDDGQWRDVWLGDRAPVAARCQVWTSGATRPVEAVALYREYAQTYDGTPQGLWAKMPANQLGKCARAAALRMAFPSDLAGLYADDEMQQADVAPPPQQAGQPPRRRLVGKADVDALRVAGRGLTKGEAIRAIQTVNPDADQANALYEDEVPAAIAALEGAVAAKRDEAAAEDVQDAEVVA